MTRLSTATHILPQTRAAAALMLGAALALIPLSGRAQDAQPAPATAGSDMAAPMQNASPAANTSADSSSAAGDTGAPSAESAPAQSAEGAGGASGMASGDGSASGLRQAGGILRNAEGEDIGSVIVTDTASGVMHLILDVRASALSAAQHALHIHETGSCEGPDFKSAGGHLAGGKDHGVHSANGPHPGDLPNITMGESGALHVEFFMAGIDTSQVLDDDGSALIIHAGVDDYASQPAGNAGDRVACAVLEPTT